DGRMGSLVSMPGSSGGDTVPIASVRSRPPAQPTAVELRFTPVIACSLGRSRGTALLRPGDEEGLLTSHPGHLEIDSRRNRSGGPLSDRYRQFGGDCGDSWGHPKPAR